MRKVFIYCSLLIIVSCSDDNGGGIGNQPTSCFEFSVDGGIVKFDASCSSNAESWDWEFGDGTTSITQNPNHTYTTPGSRTVSLRITSSNGKTATSSKDVRINEYCEKCRCRASGVPSQATEFCGTRQQAADFCKSCDEQDNQIVSCECD